MIIRCWLLEGDYVLWKHQTLAKNFRTRTVDIIFKFESFNNNSQIYQHCPLLSARRKKPSEHSVKVLYYMSSARWVCNGIVDCLVLVPEMHSSGISFQFDNLTPDCWLSKAFYNIDIDIKEVFIGTTHLTYRLIAVV